MKNIFITGFLLMAIALMMPSCKKDHNPAPSAKPDSLVFGRYNPLTMPLVHSSQFYVLKNDSLYAYPTPYFRLSGYFTEQALPDSLYQIAKYLIDNFPAYLMQHPKDSAIGCPGCADGPVIMLRMFSDSTVLTWEINSDTSQLPAELKQYIWRAGIIIDQL